MYGPLAYASTGVVVIEPGRDWIDLLLDIVYYGAMIGIGVCILVMLLR